MKLAALHELGDLFSGKLPRFLTRTHADPNAGGYLPVFTFHTLEPDDFDAKLTHLARNGYHTLTLDAAVEHVRGGRPAPAKSVVLTIDDGRLSTWTVGQPLLRRHNLVATAFIIPGYTDEGAPRPALGEPGFTPLDEVADRQTFCNWAEVEAMHRGGHMQIESHTTLHRRVLTAATAGAVLQPGYTNNRYLIPSPVAAAAPWPADAPQSRVGTPMQPARPLLAVDAAFDPPDGPVTEGATWHANAIDTDAAQRWELVTARRLIEQRLPGKVVRHFCYPESLGTARSLRHVEDAGYASACWGTHDARVANRPGGDPLRLGRLKHDYIPCLPGAGRVPLPRILWLKAARRLSERTGF